ncbi:MAG: HEAT repeat domain-containing protein [Armatimonadota bacterium]
MNSENQKSINRLIDLADKLASCDQCSPALIGSLLFMISDLLFLYIDDDYDNAKAPIWDNKIEPVIVDLARKSESGKVRARAVDMLGDFSDGDTTVSVIINALSDQDKHVRNRAAQQIKYVAHDKPDLAEKASQVLLHLLSDPSKDVRQSAYCSLGGIAGKHTNIRKLILDFLMGPIPERCEALWNAIMAADDAFCLDSDPPVSKDELKEYADALVSVLMRLKENKAQACWKAGESLGFHIKGKIGFNALIQALKSPYACGRWSAVSGLQDLRNPKAVPYLEEIAQNDRSAKVRDRAREVIDFLQHQRKQ